MSWNESIGGHREVAALDRGTVPAVAVLVLLAGVPGRLFGFDLAERARHVDVPAHMVEHEELGLRTEEGSVADARRLEVGLGAPGERARIALVRLAVARLDHVARDHQRGLFVERVDVGRGRIRHQQHVGRLDALPAGDRGTVERVARRELVLVEVGQGDGHVLFFAAGIGEAEVDELDFVLRHHLHHVGDGLGSHQWIS
jgi:hypothetical protein